MNKVRALILVLTIMVLFSFLFEGTLEAKNDSFEIIQTGNDFITIEYKLDEYELIPVEIDGVEYLRLFHPEAGFIADEGQPELLNYSVLLSIPSTGQVALSEQSIIDTSTIENINIFPSQGLDLVIDERVGFLKDEGLYKKDFSFGKELIQIGTPAIMRDERLISVTINPFSFNPARQELTVVNNIRFTVNFDIESRGENELISDRLPSEAFARIMRRSVLNYGQHRGRGGSRQDYQKPHIVIVYHNNASLLSVIEQLAEWKRNKGYQVTITSNAGMTSMVQITNYLRTAYNTWENRPEYALFIGTFNEIPTNNGDNPYTLLDGNDTLPDIILGRLAVSSQQELATVWNKIRNYEMTPYMAETGWYNNALLIGDRYASSKSMGLYVKELMLGYSDRRTFTEHYSPTGAQNFATQINNGINAGTSYFMYRGWLGMSGWSPSDAHLNNGYRLFNGTFITCGTLNTGASSNAVTSVNMGTPAQPKGAITAIGMFTGGTNSVQNNDIQAGIYYGLFVEDLRTMGEAMVRAKLHLWKKHSNSYPTPMNNHLLWCTLIGDPSMYVWREIPKTLHVNHTQELPKGSNSVRIVVTDSDQQPIEDAWVTIRQGTDVVLSTGYTDASGTITHFFSPTSTGEIKVIVTKHDYKPHLGSVTISNTNGAVTFDDVVSEDNFTAGGQSLFRLSVKNHLNQQVTGVNGTISTTSEYITINTANSAYPNIGAGATVNSASNYSINISPDTPSNYKAEFNLNMTDNNNNNWLSRFVIPISNGKLSLERLVVQDGNNSILEPGEQAQLRFHLKNEGTVDLTNVYGRILGGGRGLAIDDSTGYFGTIGVGQSVTGRDRYIEVTLSSYVNPGTIYDLTLHLFNESGYSQKIRSKLEVGIIAVTDPLGPDEYGYWCYDEGDVEYVDVPEYDWIEIAPQRGGNGRNTNLQADHNNVQGITTMDLPFTFRFYGEEYDVVSICANGWISFNPTEQAQQHNAPVPGPHVPRPMVAVFWDNLSLAQGAVFTYFDEADDIFIIQWENALNFFNNSPETFQVILYDPAVYPTLSLDAPIKMQYRVFNNVNNASGTPNGEWGNYATIGIADHTGKIGLEYSYCNRYPTAARQLRHESAIYWTTGLSEIYVAVESFSFNDGDNRLPEYGEEGDIDMTLVNIGIKEGHNVVATLHTEDDYVTILQNRAIYGDIEPSGFSLVNNAYTIRIADNVPHNHRVTFYLSITADGDNSWDDYFYMTINAPQIATSTAIVFDPEPSGNSNGLIDPGEELIIYFPIVNEGGSRSPELEIEVFSDNDLAEVVSISETSFSYVNPNESLFPAVTVAISEEAEVGDRLILSFRATTGRYSFTGQSVFGIGGLIPIQIGEGNEQTGPNEPSPINVYYRSLRSQTVYTVAELEAAGMTVGLPMPLIKFGYYVATAPAHPLINFRIRMKHTRAMDAAEHDDGELEPAYSNNSYRPRAGDWDILTLNTPFLWNGVDNILVDTSFSPVQQWDSSGQVRVFEQENGFRFGRADSPDQGTVETTTVANVKPQVFMMLGSDPEDAHRRPRNLTYDFTGTVVELEWQAPTREASGRASRNRDLRDSDQTRNPDGYNVYLNGRKINDELVETTTYRDASFDPLSINYYYVTSVYGERETAASNVISIMLNRVYRPVLATAEGTYYEPFYQTITTETEDALIYYTLDGSEPTEDDMLYQEPFEINWECYLRVRAFKEDFVASEIVSAHYNIVYPPRQVKTTVQINNVYLRWTEPWTPEDNRMERLTRRTNDGARESSENYRTLLGYNVYRSVEVDSFIVMNDQLLDITSFRDSRLETGVYDYYVTAVYEELGESKASEIATAYVGITAPPVFAPEPGEYEHPVKVTMTCDTPDASIYYTIDGTIPTPDSTPYTGEPVAINNSLILKAIARYEGWGRSTIVSGRYTIMNTSAEEEISKPLVTHLHNAYPNPFNPQTTISFDLRADGRVQLEIFNISGQRIKSVVNDYIGAGSHSYLWKGDDDYGNKVGSGVYFYKLTAPDYCSVKKGVLLK